MKKIINNIVYEPNDDEGWTLLKSYDSNSNEIIIPQQIEGKPIIKIGYKAFYGCSKQTSITIPDSVTSIGNNAFLNCSSLTIYCQASSQPSGWNSDWNPSNRPVVWGIHRIRRKGTKWGGRSS